MDPLTSHPQDPIEFWVDGSCIGNPGPCGVGVVMLDRGVKTELSRSIPGRTNNVAELAAVALALRSVEDRTRPVVIHTDSQYAINTLSGDWTAKANLEEVHAIQALLRQFSDVRLVWVRGHDGDVDNGRADALAKAAARGTPPSLHKPKAGTKGNQGRKGKRGTGHTTVNLEGLGSFMPGRHRRRAAA